MCCVGERNGACQTHVADVERGSERWGDLPQSQSIAHRHSEGETEDRHPSMSRSLSSSAPWPMSSMVWGASPNPQPATVEFESCLVLFQY